MRIEITDGKVSVIMSNGQVFKMPETNKALKEVRKYKKRKTTQQQCDLCDFVFVGKRGLNIHKHYKHNVVSQ
jgi:hypothetical protein